MKIFKKIAALCMAIWSIEVLDYILYALFAIAVVLLVVLIIKVARQKPNNEIENKVE